MTEMKLFTCRLPEKSITKLHEIAKKQHLPLRSMVRGWILQRLDDEMGKASSDE
jgi:hypothetical protein